MQHLISLGWDTFFEQQDKHTPNDGRVLGRVTEEHRLGYVLLTNDGPVRAIMPRGSHLSRGTKPVVGDWVRARLIPGAEAWIERIYMRKTGLHRKVAGRQTAIQFMAANIDVVFIVTSMNMEFNLRRLERYLAMVLDGGARPVLVLNKADLVHDAQPWRSRASQVAPGLPVVTLSALQTQSADKLRSFLGTGQTAVLVGSSGVGKSTLANTLLGVQAQRTSAIREDDHEGRHTTTGRNLLRLPNDGGLLIDTPGIRELHLSASAEAVDQVFPEVQELATACRFRNCTHQGEPGCALQDAIEEGDLDPRRLSSYKKLQREVAYFEEKHDTAKKRKAAKKFGRMIKRTMKNKRSREW